MGTYRKLAREVARNKMKKEGLRRVNRIISKRWKEYVKR